MSRSTPVYFRSIPDTKIVFNYIPRKYLTSELHITNITDQPIAFKVKTNVPTSYLVKPHLGIILPQRSVDISITMQPTDYNPQNASISDKFLVNAIPLPSNIELSTLSDQAQFSKIWEEVPKSQLQAVKLSVALQFEDGSRNTSILDKTAELDSSKDLSKDSLLDSKKRETAPTDPKRSMTSELGSRETRNATSDLSSSGLMKSFSNDTVELMANRNISVEKTAMSRLENEQQTLMSSHSLMATNQKSDVNEKKREQLDAPAPEEKKVENKTASRNLEEKAEQLEKREGELTQEKNNLNQKNQDLNTKNEDLRKMLFDLSEENTRLKSELLNLKNSTFKEKSHKKEGSLDVNVYQLWHVLVVAIIAMILGAFLSTN